MGCFFFPLFLVLFLTLCAVRGLQKQDFTDQTLNKMGGNVAPAGCSNLR